MNHSNLIPGRRAGGAIEPSGSLWPNGEFSIGYAPCGGMERELTAKEYADKWTPPLGLAMASNSHSPRDYGKPPRGTGGLTSYGRRLVRNSVEMLERAYGATNLSFATMTLPELEYEEYWNVSSNWSEVVRVFYQSVRRKLGSKLLPPFYVGVSELQPERTRREEIPALHIHFVFVGRRRGEKAWRVRPVELREMWKKSVERFCWNEYNWDACERVEGIRHTAAGYLSKYMSKGDTGTENLRRDNTGWSLPTAWYNVSLKLKQKVIEKVRSHSDLMELMEMELRWGYLQNGCEYFYEGSIQEMPGPGPHYFVGRLKKEAMAELIKMWRESVMNGS